MAGHQAEDSGPALALVQPAGRRGDQPPARSPASVSSPRPSRSSAWMARRPSACAASPAASAWFPARCTATSAARNSSTILSSTPCSPRSTAGQTPLCPRLAQVVVLAHRLRVVLEDHSGIAALLKTRDPLSPASLALAEAFLAALHAAGLRDRQAALAFRLIYDYTLGFALAGPASPAEQRLGDSATRRQLHAFLRSLPASSFPTLATHGTYAWADDREERFTSGLDTLMLRPAGSPALTRIQPRFLTRS